ncbi:hypothetical protein SLEP1_g1794 [Rubroshorea leprosula]|uniref:Uncharacterized protein n=1 Tax=Rubroshorea leprosula TaxID=152421 RepID=A0AAV5HEW6_9ROSI|nr:hypothetical protein SLEP1_g1794 [Rubroshorea leprosula]
MIHLEALQDLPGNKNGGFEGIERSSKRRKLVSRLDLGIDDDSKKARKICPREIRRKNRVTLQD